MSGCHTTPPPPSLAPSLSLSSQEVVARALDQVDEEDGEVSSLHVAIGVTGFVLHDDLGITPREIQQVRAGAVPPLVQICRKEMHTPTTAVCEVLGSSCLHPNSCPALCLSMWGVCMLQPSQRSSPGLGPSIPTKQFFPLLAIADVLEALPTQEPLPDVVRGQVLPDVGDGATAAGGQLDGARPGPHRCGHPGWGEGIAWRKTSLQWCGVVW